MTDKKTYRGLNRYGDIIEKAEHRWSDLIEGTENFVEVTTVGGGGWEWEEARIWHDARTGRYYWSHQSGCSCNSFEVDGLGSLSEGDRAAAIRAVKSIVASSYFISAREISEGAARIRNFDPRKVTIDEAA